MRPERVVTVWQGLVAGLLAYAVVIGFFALVNALAGRSVFHTAAVMGSALFYGATEPSQIAATAGPVLSFNGVHMVLCLAFGMTASWLAEVSERNQVFLYVAAILLVSFAFHIFGFVLGLNASVRGAIPAWSTFVSGLLGSGAIAAYLLRVHPGVRSLFSQLVSDELQDAGN